MKTANKRSAIGAIVGLCLGLAFSGLSIGADTPKDETPTKPTIKLTEVPKIEPGNGPTAEIKGTVSGLKAFKGYKVVIYSKGGSSWWVQPTAASPLTDIGDDGEFSADIHGGTEYAALLVKESYSAKAQIESLPAKGGEVVDITKKKP